MLAASGIASPGLVVVPILGANLGGAIPPVVATLASPPEARRITRVNLLVRATGCVLALPLAGFAAELLQMLPISAEKLPVDAHLAFNLLLALIAWPFGGLISDVMARLIPDEPEKESGPQFLDPEELRDPVRALANVTREVLGVGDQIERILIRAENAFKHSDLAPLKEITVPEGRVDRLQQDVKIYLSKLGQQGLEDVNSRRSIAIIDYAINLEHIGDIIEKGLCDQLAKKITKGLSFSEDGYRELADFFDLTINNLRTAQTVFVTGDFNLVRRLMEIKVVVRRLEKQSSERHPERLRDGRPESLQTSPVHLDMLRDLKRINAHIVSVAHPILDEGGSLVESRLRQVDQRS